ncbi:MAG: MBL fold metallo-hydrolase [Candidatus Thorarchaeota archaeon]
MSEYPVHIQVQPKVHLIRGGNRARFPEANSLLVDDEILTLVDAGSDLEHIEKTVKDLGHELVDIDRIILSHFHLDHKGLSEVIREKAECEVLCHPLADKGVNTFSGMAECYGIESHRYYEDWKTFLVKMRPYILADYTITGHFTDGKPIDCGEIELLPIHAPGHTLDHTIFGINGVDSLLLVDIDLTKFGPWYGNDVSNLEQFKESVRRVIDLEPKQGISSHLLDPVSENLCDLLETYLSAFDQRETKILELISNGFDTIEKLSKVPTIYPRIPMSVYLVFEEAMLEKHIEDLEKRNIVIRVEDVILLEK